MNDGKQTILMAAAECRGIAKVGGLGDVVFDLSRRLQAEGNQVLVVIPFYESLGLGAEVKLDFLVHFGGKPVPARLRTRKVEDLTVFLLESAYYQGEWGEVYIDSASRGKGPFEDDAQRFAFFCAALLELLKHQAPFSRADVVHCHDWHTGPLPLLLRMEGLDKRFRTLFTIHNLDYQGVRPLDDPYAPFASFRQWFPERFEALLESSWIDAIRDPQAQHCFNPMRCAIALSDGVNTVSPTYASEITKKDDPASNFIGGRGLEADLSRREAEGRLWGILNGLDYEVFDPELLSPPYRADSENLAEAKAAHKSALLNALPATVKNLQSRLGKRFKNAAAVSAHLEQFLAEAEKRSLVVVVTRAVSQKLGLFLDRLDDGVSVLDAFLEKPLCLLAIGSGELEADLEVLNTRPNSLFLCAFDAQLAQDFYSAGDLFLMPSDFEPCGISQLMAMRYGCLPIVHDRGGLHDTVEKGKTGFVFQGADRSQARINFLKTTDEALKALKSRVKQASLIRKAMKQRFDWAQSVRSYTEIYGALRSLS